MIHCSNSSLVFFKPDQVFIVARKSYESSRPEYQNKFKKIVFFVLREGGVQTIKKIKSKKIQSKIESKFVLLLAQKKNIGVESTLIGIGFQFDENLPLFFFHKYLTVTVKNRYLQESVNRIKKIITTDNRINTILSSYNLFSNEQPEIQISEMLPAAWFEERSFDTVKFPNLFYIKKVKDHKKQKLYVIGAGDYTRTNILGSIDKFERECIIDYNFNLAFYAAKQFQFNSYGTHYQSLIEKIQSERNPVFIIASYHSTHTPIALDLIKTNASAYIFIEKPPVTTKEQLSALLDVYDPSKIFIGYNRRHIPWVQEIKRKSQKRESPLFINMTIKEVSLNSSHWYFWRNQGTRITGNLCHWIDLAVYWVNSVPVSLTLNKSKNSDNLVLTIAFEDGSLVNLFATETGNSLRGVQEKIEIRFDDSTIFIDDFLKMVIFEGGKKKIKRKLRRDKGHDRMYKHFQDAVLNQQPDIYTRRDLILSSLTYLKASEMFLDDMNFLELNFSSYQL